VSTHFLAPLVRREAVPMALQNGRTGLPIASAIEAAFDSDSRRRGLLGRDHFPVDHALIIAPSSLVHTFFMRFPIDVLIVSRAGIVLRASHRVPPRRVVGAWGGFAVIEMAAESAGAASTRRGDQILVVALPEVWS